MSLLCRLLTRVPTYKTVIMNKNHFAYIRPIVLTQVQRQSTEIRIKPVEKITCEPGLMEHDAHNLKLGRPMTPHLSIYKAQLTSWLSFLHRFTGVTMTCYVYAVVLGTWFWADITSFFDLLAGMDEYLGEMYWNWAHNFVKVCIGFPFIYHSLNAVRHLGWDVGRFLPLKQVYSTGYVLQIVVILATIGFVCFL